MLIGIHVRNFGILHRTTIGVTRDQLRKQAVHDFGRFDSSGRYPLNQLTVLIGKNSSGKSSLIDALSFVTDCLKYDVQVASTLSNRGGFARLVTAGASKCVSFSLVFDRDNQHQSFLCYQLQISCDDHGRPFISAEKASQLIPADSAPVQKDQSESFESEISGIDQKDQAAAPQLVEQVLLDLKSGKGTVYDSIHKNDAPADMNDLKHPALAVYGMLRFFPELSYLYSQISHWYFCLYGKTDMNRPRQHSKGGHKHINHACDNIENVLEYYRQEHPGHYTAMMKRLDEKMPEEKPVDQAFYDGSMTSGSLKLFAHLLLLEDPHPRPLLCFEEPETGLYHDMVDLLSLGMRDYTIRHPNCQIIFITHSPFVLESIRPEEIWVFRRKKQIDSDVSGQYQSIAGCAAKNNMINALYEQGVGMSAIWYSGHFDQGAED